MQQRPFQRRFVVNQKRNEQLDFQLITEHKAANSSAALPVRRMACRMKGVQDT